MSRFVAGPGRTPALMVSEFPAYSLRHTAGSFEELDNQEGVRTDLELVPAEAPGDRRGARSRPDGWTLRGQGACPLARVDGRTVYSTLDDPVVRELLA